MVVIVKNRAIRHKNRLLAQQIADALKYKEKYLKEKNANTPMAAVADLGSLSDEQLYHYIDNIVISEHLFTDPTFGRDSVMQRFSLSKERVGTIFAKGSTHAKMSNYIQQLRLEYAALLLTEHTDRNIAQIATDSGFSSSAYFSNCFRQHFGMSPSDYRRESTETRDAKCTS